MIMLKTKKKRYKKSKKDESDKVTKVGPKTKDQISPVKPNRVSQFHADTQTKPPHKKMHEKCGLPLKHYENNIFCIFL